jgi:hypothetical protein
MWCSYENEDTTDTENDLGDDEVASDLDSQDEEWSRARNLDEAMLL